MTEARAVYDALAEKYVEWAGTQLSAAIDGLLDRTLLDDFLELASTVPGGRPVADLGCGPGRVAAYVVAHGFDAVGLDVSSAMLAEASAAHPEIGFAAAALADLPVRDAGLAGAVCWYSIIHTPPERLDEICVELARVLVPEAPLLVAFQSGDDEGVRRDDAFGTGRALTSHRHRPDAVSLRLAAAGFQEAATTIRNAELPHESTPQAFVLARAPAARARRRPPSLR